MKTKKTFIDTPEWPNTEKLIKEITLQIHPLDNKLDTHVILKLLCLIATNAWKARGRVIDKESGEPRNEMKKISRNIENILDSIKEFGIEIKDRTGEDYDYGLPEKVIATRPTDGITRETVVEMIKPTILYQGKIIQYGEVELAVPIKNNN